MPFLYILQAINSAMAKNTDDNQSFNLEKTSLDFLEKHDTNLRLAFEQKDYRKALYHIDQALKIASASQRLKLSRYTAFKKFLLHFTFWTQCILSKKSIIIIFGHKHYKQSRFQQ